MLSMFAVYFQQGPRRMKENFMIKNLHIKYIYVLLIALLYTYDLSMKCYSKSLICHDSLFSLLTILQSTNASKMSL